MKKETPIFFKKVGEEKKATPGGCPPPQPQPNTCQRLLRFSLLPSSLRMLLTGTYISSLKGKYFSVFCFSREDGKARERK
jgi:hypothetical protein